jgi:molybdopterin-guanine dinucleotide biosynthesis protein MobB
MTEFRGSKEPSLKTLLSKMEPVDVVLIEGWKSDSHPKIETWRNENGNPVIAANDNTILAVASDLKLELACPVLDLNDTNSVTDFIIDHLELSE